MSGMVSSKGQITIPLKIRKRLGVHEGDRLDFIIQEGEVILRPARAAASPFAAYAGKLGTFPGGVEEIREWVADLRDDDEDR